MRCAGGGAVWCTLVTTAFGRQDSRFLSGKMQFMAVFGGVSQQGRDERVSPFFCHQACGYSARVVMRRLFCRAFPIDTILPMLLLFVPGARYPLSSCFESSPLFASVCLT